MYGILQSCSSDEDNFFAIANVEFTASVVPSKTSQADRFNDIVGLIIEDGSDGVHYLSLQAHPGLPNAIDDIENALFFCNPRCVTSWFCDYAEQRHTAPYQP